MIGEIKFSRSTGLSLRAFRHVVEDQHLVDEPLEPGTELLVLRMRQVGFEIRLRLEGDEKTMGESIRLALRADVGAPLQFLDLVDALLERDEGLFHLLHLSGGRVRFEFEKHDVAVWGICRGHGGEGKNECGERGEGGLHPGRLGSRRKADKLMFWPPEF